MILQLAWRNLWRNTRRTGILLCAVSIGVAGVIGSMAINNGMIFQMVETAISTEVGHLQLHATGYDENPSLGLRLEDGGRAADRVLEEIDLVRASAPRVRGEGLLFSPRASIGVRVLGVDPGRESGVTSLSDSIVAGRFLDGESRRILVGKTLARRLKVNVGSRVVLSVQDLTGDLTGESFRIGGIFRSASVELERSTILLRLEESQRLYGLGDSVTEMVVIAEERSQISELRRVLEARLGPDVRIDTWQELRPYLAQTVVLFDQLAWYVYAAVFFAMVFGITNVLFMSVYERLHEIGILMAMGLKPRRIVAMIVAESTLLTFLGIAMGFGAALLAVAALQDGIDLSRWAEGLASVGVGTRIVPVIRGLDVALPLAAGLVTAVLASFWPALRAARMRPAYAVRQV